MTPEIIALGTLTAAVGVVVLQFRLEMRRDRFIRRYTLPDGLFHKLRKRHPQLDLKDCQLVAQGLRQFFLAHLNSDRKFVSMPSQVADDLWHEFILYTKEYQQFCRRAFGRFLHHTPAVVLTKGQQGNAGLRRCWFHACREENINPRQPTRLPLLFALDQKLNLPNGFAYSAKCRSVRRQVGDAAIYCGADLGGPTAGCGGDAGCGADGHSGSDGGTHSGCGGDGGSGSGSGCGSCGGGCAGGCGGD